MYRPIILKYDLDSFEPFISRRTFDIHYNKLYLRYLDRLNKVLIKNNFDFSYQPELLYKNISSFPIIDRDDIIYNAGGVINHELYFNGIRPNRNMQIKEPLNGAINKQYGNFENFVDEFRQKALLLTGSGYTFLAVNNRKELIIINLSNQDSPYFYDLIPIMNIDVWEHAYFLDTFHDRGKYLDNIFRFIDYNTVNNNYIDAIKQIDLTNQNR